MKNIGFIGLGIMGKPMALNLIKAGYSIHLLESSGSAKELIDAGGMAHSSCKILARECDVVITMLPDSPEVESVVLGKDGVIEGIQSGSIFVDMSTIAPATAKQLYGHLKKQGVEALDAPVSGGELGAISG